MTVSAEGYFIGPRALLKVMRKTPLRAHIRLDKGNVTSNQEGPMSSMFWALGEQKARGTDTVTPRQGPRKSSIGHLKDAQTVKCETNRYRQRC